MRPLNWSLIAFPADKCINSFVDNSNNVAVNKSCTCTSTSFDSGGICNLEQKPKLTKNKEYRKNEQKTSTGGNQI